MNSINTNFEDRDIKVLIAEDHITTAKLIAGIVERSAHCKVVGYAFNGRDAINMARVRDFDVILMDVDMPFIDGLTAMEAILSFNVKVKIIMVSGHSDLWIIKKSINDGADGFVSKQSDLNILGDAITTVYGGGAFLDQTAIDALVGQFDDLPKTN